MKYTKAVQCDFCGSLELSISKKKFESWFNFLGWLKITNSNGIDHEFCSNECYEKYRKETVEQ